jgi:opacity protein-like surface antigen
MSRRVRYLALALLASVALGASACADATAPDVCADSGYNGSGTLDSGYNGSGTGGYNGSGTSGYNGSGT